MNDTVVIDSINYSTEAIQYVTLDHKTSLKCQFFKIKIYTSSESWINKLLSKNVESKGAKKSKF